jgi:hypothetical protein
MTHLTPDQFVDALDAALPPDRQAHLDGCASCRAELATLQEAMALAHKDETVEPSPLFWNHLESRVRVAVGEIGATPRATAWWTGWRLASAAAVAVAAVGFAMWMQWASRLPDTSNQLGPGFNAAQAVPDRLSAAAAGEIDPASSSPAEAVPGSTPAARGNAPAWQSVVKSAAGLPDDHALVTPPVTGSAVMLDDLSERELREFVRLLKAEMGGM